jgi:radical SAM superfamily enzyme
MYKMKRFHIRKVDEILSETQRIPTQDRAHIKRVFLADGDALIYPQKGLITILDALTEMLPNLNRVGIYASPKSFTTKSVEELTTLREKKLKILYFGLESGDPETLQRARKGYEPDEMLALCQKAQGAGLKLSVMAILGLAGRERSAEHASATAEWINALSPLYFSLLTLFRRGNDAYFNSIEPLSNGEILEEALAIVRRLRPQKTILRSNHVSNILHLAGTYPKDRERIIAQAEAAVKKAKRHSEWFNEVPDYREEVY